MVNLVSGSSEHGKIWGARKGRILLEVQIHLGLLREMKQLRETSDLRDADKGEKSGHEVRV